MNTTVRIKASEIYKDWRVIDAAGRPLGRVASEAATYLRGKHKPTYEPHLDDGDFVIVINAGPGAASRAARASKSSTTATPATRAACARVRSSTSSPATPSA